MKRFMIKILGIHGVRHEIREMNQVLNLKVMGC